MPQIEPESLVQRLIQAIFLFEIVNDLRRDAIRRRWGKRTSRRQLHDGERQRSHPQQRGDEKKHSRNRIPKHGRSVSMDSRSIWATARPKLWASDNPSIVANKQMAS